MAARWDTPDPPANTMHMPTRTRHARPCPAAPSAQPSPCILPPGLHRIGTPRAELPARRPAQRATPTAPPRLPQTRVAFAFFASYLRAIWVQFGVKQLRICISCDFAPNCAQLWFWAMHTYTPSPSHAHPRPRHNHGVHGVHNRRGGGRSEGRRRWAARRLWPVTTLRAVACFQCGI